jgi:hypothetical protein
MDFLHPSTGCSENYSLKIRKIRHHQRKALTVGRLLPYVQTEETSYKKVLLKLDRVPSKHGLPLSYTVAGSGRFRKTVSEAT